MSGGKPILGIACYYHDSAACLVTGAGQILAAAQEERFSRIKQDSSFPRQAASFCLAHAGVTPDQLGGVIFYEKPLLKMERIAASIVDGFPYTRDLFLGTMKTWVPRKLWIEAEARRALRYKGPFYYSEHHLSHAASAFLPSPFSDAAILTVDGVGEWSTACCGVGEDAKITLDREIRFPHSLGLLYAAFTEYLGFTPNSDEYKLMGLAAYGKPEYAELIRQNLVQIGSDGGFRLNTTFFGYQHGRETISRKFLELFGPRRMADEPAEDRHKDLAASVQLVLEDALVNMARSLQERTRKRNLVLAGGVALNCVANSRIRAESGFDDVWIQPAADDAGGALGAALLAIYDAGVPRVRGLDSIYLGPEYDDTEIRKFLQSHGVTSRTLDQHELVLEVASLLAAGNVVGWHQGRMEFGPRSLGARSILASPLTAEMQAVVNEKIKHREQFRPFAPTVLADRAREFFELDCESPYMLLTAPVRGTQIPAVTHVDGTARIQTLERSQNPLYYDLIQEFGRITGVPVLLNTSFNVRGEPIVCSPADALNCFSHTDMDYLALGSELISTEAKRKLARYPGRKETTNLLEMVS